MSDYKLQFNCAICHTPLNLPRNSKGKLLCKECADVKESSLVKQINILGTDYLVTCFDNFEGIDLEKYKPFRDDDVVGYSHYYNKTIAIRPPYNADNEDKYDLCKEIARRELISAMLRESDLCHYIHTNDEVLCTWLSRQFWKIHEGIVRIESIVAETFATGNY